MSTRNPSTELTQARLKELLHYNPETGAFTWLVGRGGNRAGGTMAGAVLISGYVRISIGNIGCLAHRLAFLYVIGTWPEHEVDHINGVRNDNRWVNLRTATASENQHNIERARRNSSHGFLGVDWHNSHQKWRAQIRIDGRKLHLGYHATPELAHAAYLKAKDELHPTHMRLRNGR